MRVVIFSTYALPHIGGLEKNTHNLAKRLVKRGLAVDIVCFNTEKAKDKQYIDGVRYIRWDCKNFFGGTQALVAPWKLNKLIKKLKPETIDIVMSQTRFFQASHIAQRVGKNFNIPHIHVERGTSYVKHNNPIIRLGAYLVDIVFCGDYLKRADKVIGVSQAAIDFCGTLGGVTGEVIHNGIETVPREKNESGKINLLFAGRLIEAKGVANLLEAIRGMDESLKAKVKLQILGDGNARAKLELESIMLGIEVEFLGSVPEKQVRSLMAKADIFFNPSYTEGLPTGVMEAVASGCAVIATNVGGTEEIVKDDFNGLLHLPHDVRGLRERLEYLIVDNKRREEMGNNGYKAVANSFDWKEITDRYIEVFKEVRNKKVVILSVTYTPFLSGAEFFVKEMSESLNNKYGMEIWTARFRQNLPKEEIINGVMVRRLGFGWKGDKWLFPFLAVIKLMSTKNIALVHAIMASYAGMAVLLYKKLRGKKPTLLTLQSGTLNDPKNRKPIPDVIFKAIHTTPDAVHAISVDLAKRAKWFGVEEVEVIPNGVTLSNFTFNDEKVPGRILYLGRLERVKGIDIAVQAMSLAIKECPELKFIIAGDGSMKKEIEDMVQALGISEETTMLGRVDMEGVAREMSQAEMLIGPSRQEGLGSVFVEAQAAGTPAVASRVGGIPDVITDGVNGILIDPESPLTLAEEIVKLHRNDNLRAEMMIEAEKNSKQYDWSLISAKIDNIYKDLIK